MYQSKKHKRDTEKDDCWFWDICTFMQLLTYCKPHTQPHTHTHTHTHIHTHIHTYTHTHRGTQAGRQAGKQTYRQTDKQRKKVLWVKLPILCHNLMQSLLLSWLTKADWLNLDSARQLVSLATSSQKQNIKEARRRICDSAFASGIASSSAARSLAPLENMAPPRRSPPIPEAIFHLWFRPSGPGPLT